MDKNNIARRWKVLSGQNKWQGLLEPLDTDLQKYILHCGAMAASTYDAFNVNPLSKHAGNCRYSIRNYMSRTGLVLGNPFKYKVVKYIYAAAVIGLPGSFMVKPTTVGALYEESNWIGFVAVATDEGKKALGRRDIMVAWRGTVEVTEWAKDFDFPMVSANEIIGKVSDNASMHHGFLSIYTSSIKESKHNKTSAREQVMSEIRKQMELHKDEEVSITITGHSMGAAVAIINGADIAANGHNLRTSCRPSKACLITVINFGCPRVGDDNFKRAVESMHDLCVLRVVNHPDLVPRVPPKLHGYTHLGELLRVNNLMSPHLKVPVDIISWHNIEPAYLHPLAIANGATNLRSLSLVNKNSGALRHKYMCPIYWWKERNKGMVQKRSGSWILLDHGSDDDKTTVDSEIF